MAFPKLNISAATATNGDRMTSPAKSGYTMGGKTKTTQNSQQQSQQSTQQQQAQQQSSAYDNRNEIGFAQVPEWQGLTDLRNFQEQEDPRIGYMRANRERQAMSAYGPAGAYSSPELQREQTQARLGEISQDAGNQYATDAYNRNLAKGQRLGTIAQLSAPVSYNARSSGTSSGQGTSNMTGNSNMTGSSSGTQVTQGPGFFSQLGSAVASGIGGLISGPFGSGAAKKVFG